jgi:hypothetical protein
MRQPTYVPIAGQIAVPIAAPKAAVPELQTAPVRLAASVIKHFY